MAVRLKRVPYHGRFVVALDPVRARARGGQIDLIDRIKRSRIIARAIDQRHLHAPYGDHVGFVLVAHVRAHLFASPRESYASRGVRYQRYVYFAGVDRLFRRKQRTCNFRFLAKNAYSYNRLRTVGNYILYFNNTYDVF